MKRQQIEQALREHAKRKRRQNMHNGKPQGLPCLSVVADPNSRSEDNPNGLVIASAMPSLAVIQMLSEAIRVIAQPLALKENAAIQAKRSKAGLVLGDGSPAPMDEPGD